MKRFRMVAGPNGSGKSTLVSRLRHDYAVNFYTMLNADDIYAEVAKNLAYLPALPISGKDLAEYAQASEYAPAVKNAFIDGAITVVGDTVKFATPEAVNSYTIALLTNFLQEEHIQQGLSFSQETVFSHPSKVAALKRAFENGFRTYLYVVANQDVAINLTRIANRVQVGGHDVPSDKVIARARRCLANIKPALPYCSRAYFFDNSSSQMRFLAEYSHDNGFVCAPDCQLPEWFAKYVIGY